MVSIITPAYNAATYLRDTVCSVLAQTFSDFELLIVDDGSTDRTLDVARRLAEADRRIRVFATVNRGQASARNVAMAHARGELFALLDADDLWWPEYLSGQVAALHRFPEAAVVTANAINLGGPRHGTPLWPATSGIRRLRLHDVIAEENAVCIMAVFRRAVVDRVGGFDPAFNGNEDYHFWIRILSAGFVILQSREPLGHYRRRSGSVSDDERRMLAGVIHVLRWTRGRSEDRPDDLALIDRRLAGFENELLLADAKANLLRREFNAAASQFTALSALRGDLRSVLVARASRRAPEALLWVYRALSAVRAGRQVLRRA
jgi:glycosyltransferase involved in cell wall biosynthesis